MAIADAAGALAVNHPSSFSQSERHPKPIRTSPKKQKQKTTAHIPCKKPGKWPETEAKRRGKHEGGGGGGVVKTREGEVREGREVKKEGQVREGREVKTRERGGGGGREGGV